VPHGNETAAILTICLASALGMLGQVIGSRWRIPPIVFLLLFGVAAGPSGLGWLRPDAIGAGLPVLVKLAVAIILFEARFWKYVAWSRWECSSRGRPRRWWRISWRASAGRRPSFSARSSR
jgi:NhaP-type Na+/H+ and K+/H+ antiporter